MNVDNHKFYLSKFKILMFLLLCSWLLYLVVKITPNVDTAKDVLFWILGIVLFVPLTFFSLFSLFSLFNTKPFITITSEYIKIRDWENIYWDDVSNVITIEQQSKHGVKNEFLIFNVRNTEKYNLTSRQKLNQKLGGNPFSISLFLFSKKDRQELKQIIGKIKKLV